MSNAQYCILSQGTKCALTMVDYHVASNLPLPIQADDAKALIYAAFQADPADPRREFHGVLADKMASGVRVRVVGRDSWFDIPWCNLARGLEVLERAA